MRRVLAAFVALRVANALLLQTYSEPDEYWQTQEVAHQLAFGRGWLTWEWREGIRDALLPSVFAVLWRILDMVNFAGNTGLLMATPRVFQGIVTAVGETLLVGYAGRVGGRALANAAALVLAGSWYQWNYAARTLSNSMESALVGAAAYFWPWPGLPPCHLGGATWAAAALLATAGAMRPTSALVAVFMVAHLVLGTSARQWWRPAVALGTTGLAAFAVGAAANWWLYGSWSLPAVKFLRANAGPAGVSDFYGVLPVYWYLVAGLPVLAGGFLPALVSGATRVRAVRAPALIVAAIVAVYSFLPHKELRFLAGAAPFAHIVTAAGQRMWQPRWTRAVVAVHLLVGIYATMVHQRGVMDVSDWLRNELAAGPAADPPVRSIGYLMPCHSTPLYARLHYPVRVQFLTCEPPLRIERTGYLDEADRFYGNVGEFLRSEFPPVMPRPSLRRANASATAYSWAWPSHLVVFEALLETEFSECLSGSPYRVCASFFNTHFHPDSRRRGRVLVYCRGLSAKNGG